MSCYTYAGCRAEKEVWERTQKTNHFQVKEVRKREKRSVGITQPKIFTFSVITQLRWCATQEIAQHLFIYATSEAAQKKSE